MGRPGDLKTVAVLLLLALVLTACSGSADDTAKGVQTRAAQAAVVTEPTTITYAHEDQFSSYNNNTVGQASVRNAVVLNQVLRGFWYFGPDGTIRPDTTFGTYRKISENPLTVRYDFSPKAVWSDGEPIDCDDAVLTWAANSNRWRTGKRDPYTGLELTAFSSASTAGYEDAAMPACNQGDRSFTLTYRTMYADWPSLFGPGQILPAHVLEREAKVPDIIAAAKRGGTAAMTRIGNVYNSLWQMRPGSYDDALAPSAGPYQVTAWKAGVSITLTPNPKWWGTPPRVRTIVVRFLAADQQAAAMRRGEIQVMDPQPDPQLLSGLKQLGSSARVTTHDEFSWEHLDYNLDGALDERQLRVAFTKCLPRQQIVDNLVKPQNPAAVVLQSRMRLPFQPGYARLATSGGQAYTTVDPAGARRILQQEHALGTTVRIGYQTPNPHRKAEVDLIRDFCGRAGFKVVDAGTPDFFVDGLRNGDFDAALFAWSGSPLVTQNYATYSSGGARNYGGYRGPQVDVLLKRLNSEVGADRQLALQADADAELWRDLPTVPLYAYPAVLATAPGIGGVEFNASQAGVTWNAQDWTR